MELGGVLNEQRKGWVNSRRDESLEETSEGASQYCIKKYQSESLSGISLDGPFLAYGHRL